MQRPVSGHVYRHEGKRGPVWRAKYRLPDGRQVHCTIGPAWTQRGRPAGGHFTRRTAEAWLREVLDQARKGTLPGAIRTGRTFADVAKEYLRHLEQDRELKPSTLRDYRSTIAFHLLPEFGAKAPEDITTAQIKSWLAALATRADGSKRSNRTRSKTLVILGGILKWAQREYDLPTNPAAAVDKPRQAARTELDVFAPEEVMALVRAAESEQDAALFLTAAFTGLRQGELLALRWRDVDFTGATIRVTVSYHKGNTSSPKSGKVRSVPMAPEVAAALARLGGEQADDALVFPGILGEHLDASGMVKRYKAARKRAGLRDLRFHDLRHTFGTRMIAKADILRVKEWMGHADVATTMRYLHYAPRADDAALVAEAFAVEPTVTVEPSAR